MVRRSVSMTSPSSRYISSSSTVNAPSIRVLITRPTRREGRLTARPSAAVLPSNPISETLIPSFSPVIIPRSIQGAWVGSAKKQWAFSPKTVLRPKVTPPGPPPTPQGKYTNRGCSASMTIFSASNCFFRRAAAVEYPRNRSAEPSSSTKWQVGSPSACLLPSATAF